MRVVVLGGGVVGVTSAWYLARAGHEVVLLERQPGPARETSFANAGEISPGYASPWAAPGVPLKALRWLAMENAPLILRPGFDSAMLRWLIAMLGNCTARAYRINKERMVRLAQFSREQLIELRKDTGISYDERSRGTLQLFRKDSQLAAIEADTAVLCSDGVPFEVLDRDGCIAAEPGLAYSEVPFVGGLRLPLDETGDCFKFTNRLCEMARAEGVEFRFGSEIRRIHREGDAIASVVTAQGTVRSDAYLVALGSYSTPMVAPLGIRLPVYPVKGYSITVPIVEEARAPVSTLLDESHKIAITRLGARIRVGGMAELSGYNRRLDLARQRTLEHSVRSLFPGAADYADPRFWAGMRPMTPDSTPVIGATPIRNLYLNTGHGTLGWTMACGSAHVIADIIGGRRPAIRTDDLSIGRYRQRG